MIIRNVEQDKMDIKEVYYAKFLITLDEIILK